MSCGNVVCILLSPVRTIRWLYFHPALTNSAPKAGLHTTSRSVRQCPSYVVENVSLIDTPFQFTESGPLYVVHKNGTAYSQHLQRSNEHTEVTNIGHQVSDKFLTPRRAIPLGNVLRRAIGALAVAQSKHEVYCRYVTAVQPEKNCYRAVGTIRVPPPPAMVPYMTLIYSVARYDSCGVLDSDAIPLQYGLHSKPHEYVDLTNADDTHSLLVCSDKYAAEALSVFLCAGTYIFYVARSHR